MGPNAEDSELKGALINVSAGAGIKTLPGPQPSEPTAAAARRRSRFVSQDCITADYLTSPSVAKLINISRTRRRKLDSFPRTRSRASRGRGRRGGGREAGISGGIK